MRAAADISTEDMDILTATAAILSISAAAPLQLHRSRSYKTGLMTGQLRDGYPLQSIDSRPRLHILHTERPACERNPFN